MVFEAARRYLAKRMRKETAEKVREEHYPAPFRLIDLFEKHGGSYESLKREETWTFAPLMVSEQSRNLRRVFKLSEMLKAEAPKNGFKPLRAHVVGAGTMGADIAMVCVAARHGSLAAGLLGGGRGQGARTCEAVLQEAPEDRTRRQRRRWRG